MLKVIALGNTLRGDDGIGPAVIDTLRELSAPDLRLIDLGGDALDLLDHLQGSEPILLVDCAKMGLQPGEIRRLNVERDQLNRLDQIISLHGLSFPEIYRLAVGLGPVPPCRLIGVEPASIEFGRDLSPEVKASIPSVIQLVFEEMHLYEEKNNYH